MAGTKLATGPNAQLLSAGDCSRAGDKILLSAIFVKMRGSLAQRLEATWLAVVVYEAERQAYAPEGVTLEEPASGPPTSVICITCLELSHQRSGQDLSGSKYSVIVALSVARQDKGQPGADDATRVEALARASGRQLARLGGRASFVGAPGNPAAELANAGVIVGIVGPLGGLPAASANLRIIGGAVPLLHRFPAFFTDLRIEIQAILGFHRLASAFGFFGAGGWPPFRRHLLSSCGGYIASSIPHQSLMTFRLHVACTPHS